MLVYQDVTIVFDTLNAYHADVISANSNFFTLSGNGWLVVLTLGEEYMSLCILWYRTCYQFCTIYYSTSEILEIG